VGCGQAFPQEAKVGRVVDGDTIELTDGRLVRYIGIDAPEVRRRARPGDREWRTGGGNRWVEDPQPFGHAATEANRALVEGKRVRLEYDVQTRDRFGRLLAYVYVSDPSRTPGDHGLGRGGMGGPPDREIGMSPPPGRGAGDHGFARGAPSSNRDVMVNAELIRLGFAQPLTIPPDVKYAERFRALAEDARRAHRGLWSGD